MSTHTKVNEEVYSEYDCTLKDCSHDECPTERVDICQECSRESSRHSIQVTTPPSFCSQPFSRSVGRSNSSITRFCPCCRNFGELSHLPGMTAMVPGEVVKQMCDECIDAAFLSDGTRPHPHPFIHATDREDGSAE